MTNTICDDTIVETFTSPGGLPRCVRCGEPAYYRYHAQTYGHVPEGLSAITREVDDLFGRL